MKRGIWIIALAVLLGSALAQPVSSPESKLRIGIYDRPPYAERTMDGGWSGLAVDMWSAIAARLGRDFEFVEVDPADCVEAIKNGDVDVLMGELTVRAASAKEIDFSHPYFGADLCVASIPGAWNPNWVVILRGVFNSSMVTVVLIVLGLLLAISAFLWLVENRGRVHFNREKRIQFHDMWWFALATLTTVGSSERGPRTLWGRLVGAAWMIMSVLLIATFTASVASSVASASVMAEREADRDLYSKRIAVVSGGLAEDYLENIGVHPVAVPTIRDGLQALKAGNVDLFIGDMLSTAYISKHEFGNRFEIARFGWMQSSVAFGFAKNSPLIDDVNVALLEVTESDKWHRTVGEWLSGLPGEREGMGNLY